MSSRHLLPVALSLCLGAAFFLYWRESGQLQTSRHSHRLLQRELTASRSERDQVQFRLNLLREDLEAAQQAREEGERRVQELDEQLQEERGKLREAGQELGLTHSRAELAETEAKECKEHTATLEEVVDQQKTQLGACEAESKDGQTANAVLRQQQEVLREEVSRGKREKDQLSQQVSEAQAQGQACRQQLDSCSSQLESMKLSEQIIHDNAGPNAVREAGHQFRT